MKRNILKTALIAAASAAMLSCSNSYPGEIYDVRLDPSVFNTETQEAERNQQEPIKIFINEQSFFSIIARGFGPFDNNQKLWYERMAESNFYIFAFRNDRGMLSTTDISGMLNDLKDSCDMRKYAHANMNLPSGSNLKDTVRLHCLLDGKDYHTGLPTLLDPDGNGQLKDYGDGYIAPGQWAKAKDTLYRYPAAQNVPYDFFGYYLDNAEYTCHREKNYIHYDIEIDGTQDLMCGQAPDLRTILYKDDFEKKHQDISIENLRMLREIGGYCGMAAHRGIHPEIDLKHKLTQLRFVAYPGSPKSNDITILKIEVSCPYKGDMVVATKDTINHPLGITWKDNESDFKWLSLKELPTYDAANQQMIDCQELDQTKYVLAYDVSKEVKDKEPYEVQSPTQLGGGMMVPSRNSYRMRITYKQNNVTDYDGNKEDYHLTATYDIKFEDGRVFEEGNINTINIVVYGLEDIQMSVYITPWKQRQDDHIEIDPDKD